MFWQRLLLRSATIAGVTAAAYRLAPPSDYRRGWQSRSYVSWIALCEEPELVQGMVYRESVDGVSKLVGAGMRRMTPLKIKVYGIGLYMSQDEVAKRLYTWRDRTAEELFEDASFWRVVCSPSVSKTIVMKVARDVSGKHLQQGFDRAMLKRVRQLAKSGIDGGKQSLKTMNTRIVEKGTFVEGDELQFAISGNGRLVLSFPDKTTVEVQNEALCLALAEMFLGERAASPEAKREFAKGFVKLI
eukprot:Plantae.Rhodophyta-Purpureofilum_apyrenoidigerum.ctg22493.p1 GENE.Plantae.Rhodophyta-Purpureofilum_apyrenoidigerum.ctg22493~~Plantae.Rhodophyta-Purpureofilum_apyrenoidigerum.ctg22493.p1  ORF type:complete len:244 (+),score=52.27 Plantae.Rhodophyta-Purpureofilum_apyrenoidigerum.ctg22493:697-1428(+)